MVAYDLCNKLPCSGKCSLVQNFVEFPFRPSEEIFLVLNFMPVLWRDHNHHQLISAIACTRERARRCTVIFEVLIFMAADLSVKNAKFCTMWKFPAIQYIISRSSQVIGKMQGHKKESIIEVVGLKIHVCKWHGKTLHSVCPLLLLYTCTTIDNTDFWYLLVSIKKRS